MLIYEKLGRRGDAARRGLRNFETRGISWRTNTSKFMRNGGEPAKALALLDTAMRDRDPGLIQLKIDPLLDQLRTEPRYQAIERALKFPRD